jgi:hypothetical protein
LRASIRTDLWARQRMQTMPWTYSPCLRLAVVYTPRVPEDSAHPVLGRNAAVVFFRLVWHALPPAPTGVPLASWCALRFGEMIELRRGDVDLDAEVIHVRRAVVRVKCCYMVGEPKSQAGTRDVAIPPHVVTMIRDHLAEHVAAPRSARR